MPRGQWVSTNLSHYNKSSLNWWHCVSAVGRCCNARGAWLSHGGPRRMPDWDLRNHASSLGAGYRGKAVVCRYQTEIDQHSVQYHIACGLGPGLLKHSVPDMMQNFSYRLFAMTWCKTVDTTVLHEAIDLKVWCLFLPDFLYLMYLIII